MALLNELNEYIRTLPGSKYDVVRNNELVKSAALNINVLNTLDTKNDRQDDFNFLLVPDKAARHLFIFIKFVNFKLPKDNGYMMIVIKRYTDTELNSIIALCNKKPSINTIIKN